MNQAAARIAREAADAAESGGPGAAALRRGRLGPDQSDRLPVPGRQRPRRPERPVRRAAFRPITRRRRAWSTVAPTSCSSRPSSTPSTRRRRSSRWRTLFEDLGCPRPGDDLGHHHRRQRPDPVAARRRRRSGTASATPGRFAIGLNCALGAKQLRPYLQELSRIADVFVSGYPNAGLPNEFGGYDEQPAETSRRVLSRASRAGGAQPRRRLLRHDARPHPRHRGRRPRSCPPRVVPAVRARTPPVGPRAAHHRAADNAVRQRRRADQRHRLAALREAHHRRTTSRPPSRSRASRSRTAPRSSTSTWTRRCSTRRRPWPVSSTSSPPSPTSPRAGDDRLLEVVGHRGRAASRVQGRSVVNSHQPQGGRGAEFLRQARLARRYGAAVVVMAFDEAGQADTVERKVAIAHARLPRC